ARRVTAGPSEVASHAVEVGSAGTATAAKYCALKPAQTGFCTSVGCTILSAGFSITFPSDRAMATSWPDVRPPLAPWSEIGVSTSPTRLPAVGAATSTSQRQEVPRT